MATVWIPIDAGHKYGSAKEHGDVRFIFTKEDGISAFQSERAAKHVAEVFAHNPPEEDDCLLFAGPTLFSVVVALELLARFSTIKILIYHMRENKYIPRDLNVVDTMNMDTE